MDDANKQNQPRLHWTFPEAAKFGRVIPKEKLYSQAGANADLKQFDTAEKIVKEAEEEEDEDDKAWFADANANSHIELHAYTQSVKRAQR